MILEGVKLMMVGMTTVFAFLGLMVATITVNHRLFGGEPPKAAEPGDDVDELEQIAVALAAIAARRN